MIVFRVDASVDIGTGHVMRCLTLAEAAARLGTRSQFICRAHNGNLINKIRDHGFETIALPGNLTRSTALDNKVCPHELWLGTTPAQDALDTIDALGTIKPDWLVVDHYGLGKDWEERLRPKCTGLMCIDDLADRPHDCDLLLDHGLGQRQGLYTNLIAPEARLLCGPEYALLRPEFAKLRGDSLSRRRNPSIRHVLVSMGGADKHNATGAVLAALVDGMDLSEIEVTVVMGASAPWLEEIQAAAKAAPGRVRVLSDTSRMAELMCDADLIVGAAGTTSWERCCLGVPSIVLVIAENQKEVADSLCRAGAAFVVKDPSALPDFLSSNREKLTSPAVLAKMADNAARITDGNGASRVASLMLSKAGRAVNKKGRPW